MRSLERNEFHSHQKVSKNFLCKEIFDSHMIEYHKTKEIV